MAEDKGQTATANESEQTEEIEAIEITSADDIASLVSALEADGVAGATARSYTVKHGFKSLQPLLTTDPHVLAMMSGCISYALAQQAADEIEGAEEVRKLAIEYAENVSTLTANMTKLNTYCLTAMEFGYGEDGEEIDDMTTQRKAEIVSEFLDAQKKKPDADFIAWTKQQATVKEAAST